jgi:hypothetical protein
VKAQPVDIQYHQKQEAAEEFGKLDALVRELAPTNEHHETRRKQIRAFFDKPPADKELLIDGPSYVIEIAPRAFERTPILMALLAKALGKGFGKICSAAAGKQVRTERKEYEPTHYPRSATKWGREANPQNDSKSSSAFTCSCSRLEDGKPMSSDLRTVKGSVSGATAPKRWGVAK